MSAHEDKVNNDSEATILTQEEVDEHIINCFTPLNKQLGDLTRLIQEMSTAHGPSHSPRAGRNASYSAAGPSCDIFFIKS